MSYEKIKKKPLNHSCFFMEKDNNVYSEK